jgi:hypothetical protein
MITDLKSFKSKNLRPQIFKRNIFTLAYRVFRVVPKRVASWRGFGSLREFENLCASKRFESKVSEKLNNLIQ